MNIAPQRHAILENRTQPWMQHILCDCGTTFGHEPSKGTLCSCPHCGASADVKGADVSPIVENQ